MTKYQVQTEHTINNIFNTLQETLGMMAEHVGENRDIVVDTCNSLGRLQIAVNMYFEELRQEKITALPSVISKPPTGGYSN